MLTRSPLPFVLCGAILIAGCSKPKIESQVDVPTTLAGVRALADPPRVTVKIERVKRYRGSGGFRCGHPVCLIVVPFALWELAFPTMVDAASVTEGGVVTYSGMFDTGGELIQARAQRGAVTRDLRVLALKALRKRLVVEVARSVMGPDGKPGPFKPTALAGQVDLVPEYRAAFAHPRLLTSSDELLREAVSWLGDEAMPLREERLKDQKEQDETKKIALIPCHGPLLKLARTAALGPRALDTALNCYTGATSYTEAGLIKEDGAEAFLDQLVDRICALKELESVDAKPCVQALDVHLGIHSRLRDALRPRAATSAARCSPAGGASSSRWPAARTRERRSRPRSAGDSSSPSRARLADPLRRG